MAYVSRQPFPDGFDVIRYGWKVVNAFPAARVAPPELRQDMHSDAMYGSFRAALTWDGSGSFLGWAWQRAHGEVIDGIRRRTHYRRADGPPKLVPLYARGDEQSDHGSVFSEATSREAGGFWEFVSVEDATNVVALKDAVRRTLAGFTVREQDMFVAHVADGENLKAIGERYGVTESRVCQVVKKVRTQLREDLAA